MMASCLLGALWLLAAGAGAAAAAEPVVSVWYRGTPVGVPRADDLAVIRARGFTGVIWPAAQSARIAELQRMAAAVGLTVSIQGPPVHLTAASAGKPPERVDIVTTRLGTAEIPALVWRAVARGARAIAFDPGPVSGSGLSDTTGRPLPWVAPAAALARQLTFNARLFAGVTAGPAVTLQPPSAPGVDVVLLEAPRAWVLVSTNTSAARVTAVADLPASVAPALWTSLLDGSNMSMLSRPVGPRWTFELGAGEAAVWTIEK